MKKHYMVAFKSQVVLEFLKEENTVSQISSEYGIHVTMPHKWKKIALDNLVSGFEDEEKKTLLCKKNNTNKDVNALYSKIGKLSPQLEWLEKKFLREFGETFAQRRSFIDRFEIKKKRYQFTEY